MTISSTSKTLVRGLSKTRTGRPPISLQGLIEKSRLSGFSDRIKKAVSEYEALDAAKRLSEGRKSRLRRYAEGGAIGGMANPVLRAVGRGVEAAVNAPTGSRVGKAVAAIRGTTRGELARHLTEGALAGGGVQAIREGVELGRAKKTVKQFIDNHTPHPGTTISRGGNVVKATALARARGGFSRKQAGVEPAPQSRLVPRRRPSDPWQYDPRPAEEI